MNAENLITITLIVIAYTLLSIIPIRWSKKSLASFGVRHTCLDSIVFFLGWPFFTVFLIIMTLIDPGQDHE